MTKLYDASQIAAAKKRAEDVVNGFATARPAQQARDIVALANTLELRNKQLETLRAKLQSSGFSSNEKSLFSEVFGDSFFGSGFKL